MRDDGTFHFPGQDSLSQFMVWVIVLGAGCGKAIHLGSRKTMHQLRAVLTPIRTRR